jgi:hypothetical protein
MEAAGTTEISVNFNQNSRRNKPEDSHLKKSSCCTFKFFYARHALSFYFFMKFMKRTAG